MMTVTPPTCLRCGGATQYEGRVSLPAQLIYRCADCGNYIWVPQGAAAPSSLPAAPPPEQPHVQQAHQAQPVQQQAQQQQNPPDTED